MTPLGLYRPGASPLHRAPAGLKLALLVVGVGVLLTLRSPLAVALATLPVAASYAVARIPPRVAWTQLRPLRWFAVFLFVVQVFLADPATATVLVLRLALTVALAALVTLTTRVGDLLAVLERLLRPLRRAGVEPARVALVLALTLRGVPVVTEVVRTVSEAHRARGLRGPPWRRLTPTMVRVLRHADALGAALTARGIGDELPAERPRRPTDRRQVGGRTTSR